jgi:hypothetical protein
MEIKSTDYKGENMCIAFSCLVHLNGKVYWKAGMDSHPDIAERCRK